MPNVFRNAREPFSSYSHFLGALGAGFGLLLAFARAAAVHAGWAAALSAALFCLSLVALYTASATYHYSLRGEAIVRRLKKLDHSMIYVLIAGSYTPVILRYMAAPDAWIFLGVIWAIALAGIAIKLIWIDAPRLLGTILYLALGWAIVFRFDVVLSMPVPAIVLLALGGLLYTAGGVIYIVKKPDLPHGIGFHELFHLFVLGGSLCHYLMVLLYVLS